MICPPVDFMPPFSLFQALEVNFKKSKQQENAKRKTTKQLEKRKGRRKKEERSRVQKENTTINKKKGNREKKTRKQNY